MPEYRPSTNCLHAGYRPGNGEPRNPPIVQSTTFRYATGEAMGELFDLEAAGYFYTRLQNPTSDAVAAKICALEGGTAAMLTSSGQAASFFAIFNIVSCGEHVVCSSSIYGGTYNLFAVTMKRMGVEFTFVEPDCSDEELAALTREQAEEKILSLMQRAYAKREEQFTSPVMREIERVVTLRVVDEFWMDHIDAMDDLRQGIRLRAYAQTDPVIEYKREGFDMFEAMNDAIKEEIVRRVFLVRLKTNEEIKRQRVAKVTGEGAGGDKTVKRQPVVKKIKVGPNDPCPCGSGKKYKKCCRDKDLAAERGQQTN